jgi:hypothetical protein
VVADIQALGLHLGGDTEQAHLLENHEEGHHDACVGARAAKLEMRMLVAEPSYGLMAAGSMGSICRRGMRGAHPWSRQTRR